jgi:hypothetical protein
LEGVVHPDALHARAWYRPRGPNDVTPTLTARPPAGGRARFSLVFPRCSIGILY